MPVCFKTIFNEDQLLTYEMTLKWLARNQLAKPPYLDENTFREFAENRNKTYGFLLCSDFLNDIKIFYCSTMVIDKAIRNLESYLKHLQKISIDQNTALNVLGIKKSCFTVSNNKELIEYTIEEIKNIITEESTYVNEAITSLKEQKAWHQKNCSSDKGSFNWKEIAENLLVHKKDAKEQVKYKYYEPIRAKLMSMGFIVSPKGTSLGAIFPKKDWKQLNDQNEFWNNVKSVTDELVKEYKLIGDDSDSMTRLLTKANIKDEYGILKSAVGCLCISWTMHHDSESEKDIYIPILGISGVMEKEPDTSYFQKFCRHLALPKWEEDIIFTENKAPKCPEIVRLEEEQERIRIKVKIPRIKEINEQRNKPPDLTDLTKEMKLVQVYNYNNELIKRLKEEFAEEHKKKEKSKIKNKVLETNYETMIHRTNLSALGYRTRELLQLRRPARQAILSYVSFREEKGSTELKIEELQPVEKGVDLWICGWHTLNCAEPAALMTASSYFCEGADVLVCFPYEGFNDTGPYRNRPKETCPWCASVEIGFRSLSENQDGLSDGVSQGKWKTQFTRPVDHEPHTVLPVNQGFDAFDDKNSIMERTQQTLGKKKTGGLVKNKDLITAAYSEIIQTKIGRIRSMYHLLGLLDREVIAINRKLYSYS